MKPRTTKIVVILIAAAIIAPAAYFAYEYYAVSNVPTNVQPFEYIPGNSTMISSVHTNDTTYYVYMDGGSIGVVANISAISQLDPNLTAANNPAIASGSGNAKLFSGSNVKTITYDHVTVYEIQNINVTGILQSALNVPGKNIANTTINIFAYDTSGNFIVIGEQKAINESISIHISSKDAVKLKGNLNQSSNISLYYNVNNTIPNISYITLNSTVNKTYVNIIPTSTSSLTISLEKLAIQNIMNSPKISSEVGNNYTITSSNGEIHLNINRGYNNLGTLVKTLNTGII